jgi:hypothetical protein
VLQKNNLHDAVCLVYGVCGAGEPLRLVCLRPYCLHPHTFYLPSSSGHESMPSLTSSSGLNGAQCPRLYAFHSSPTPKE